MTIDNYYNYITLMTFEQLYKFEGKTSISVDTLNKLRNALLDWSFNEAGQYIGDDENGNPIYKDGDANKFFNKYPKGFKFKCYKICDL